MTQREKTLFLERMSLAVRQAGAMVKALQGKVGSEEKAVQRWKGESARSYRMRQALTIADKLSQEILLLQASEILDPKTVLLDAEEETPSAVLFSAKESEITLVIDPIDGTFEYTEGGDAYSICVGLAERGKMISALVFFPARNQFYFLDPCGFAYEAANVFLHGLKHAKQIKLVQKKVSKDIYHNSRVPTKVIMSLEEKGYKVIEATGTSNGWPEAFLRCIRGEAMAFIAVTPHPRDILLGAILIGVPGGYALDWQGKTLIWPAKGRIPKTIFGIGEPALDLLQCLAD